MGSSTFVTRAIGSTAKEAFVLAQDQARWEHGHGGYSGTIAEKDDFVLLRHEQVFPRVDLVELAYEVLGMGGSHCHPLTRQQQIWLTHASRRVDDKWGPAGCLVERPGRYVFFGWSPT